jgi:hypothetical protein
MLYIALQKAKKGEDKKVAVNIQVPSTLKDAFEDLCKSEGVSMTALICALMETAVDEKSKHSFYKNDSLELVELLEKEQENVYYLQKALEESDAFNLDEDEIGYNPHNKLELAQARIQAIHIELNNRGRYSK